MANGKKKPESFLPLLKQVVKFLNQDTPESQKLWNVLTALRGPDAGMPGSTHPEWLAEKAATTAVIRHTVGLNPDLVGIGVVVNEDCGLYCEKRKLRPYINTLHFDSHVREAFKALGLEWDEVNTKPPLVPPKKRRVYLG